MGVEANYIAQCPLTTLDTLKADLLENGVAVLPNVISPEECDDIRTKMYEFLASEFQVVEPDDYQKLRPLEGMILKNYGVALRPEILDLKTDERVVESFRRIWNEQDLTTSFDAITVIGPPEKRAGNAFFDIRRTWFHTDQSSNKKGFNCIQSFVNLEDTSEGDGCLSVLFGSHHHHEEFFKRFNIISLSDYFEINTTSHHDWYTKEKGCQWAMISAPKGSMVFWDSRTIHMGTAPREGRPNPDRWRFIAYVCYMPARLQSKKDSEVKKYAYQNHCTTAHWPFGVRIEGSYRGFKAPNDLSRLSDRQKKLFGVED